MNIYYRGFLINENHLAGPGCMVYGTRPERKTMTHEDSPRAAMRWIDRAVIRKQVEAAGWLPAGEASR